ncbi:MAG: hydrogenase nickel incorporation protein HypB [Betaproteobacteria bacterium]|nr:hydrogenase nickel incorporation protein HypB [Betaproteobacteria bacterium]
MLATAPRAARAGGFQGASAQVCGPLAMAHEPGLGATQRLRIEQEILGRNNDEARRNRAQLKHHGIFALNLVSSPGAGKTTLLVRTLAALKSRIPAWVIEGDQASSRDAERIRGAGVPAVQINTGKGCHLDAHRVGRALQSLPLEAGGVLFIENVGNLVCPAAFDLGEDHKVVILSVTEGEDKPLKYPDMFHAADLMLVNKVDLLPYVSFDVEACIGYAREINPHLGVIEVSATGGQGFSEWLAWIEAGARAA